MKDRSKKPWVKIGRILIVAILPGFVLAMAVYFIWLKDYQKEALLKVGYNETTIETLRAQLPDADEEAQIEELLLLPYQADLDSFLKHPDFRPENLLKYLNYISDLDHYRVSAVVYLVNQGISQPYSDLLAALISQPYFVPARLERYLVYDNSKAPAVIIQEVNCNLDRPYYEDPQPVDLAKDNLLLVNKYYYFDSEYAPENLVAIAAEYDNNTGDKVRPEVYEAFKTMADAAANEGLALGNNSAYRSYETQQKLYERYLVTNGKEYAEELSARAGFSEHQAGLALDLGVPTGAVVGKFENTAEFAWLEQNAHRFGFILRYPAGKEHLTGYHYEPWHYRYVGLEVAEYIHEHKLTLEEYYAVFVEGQ